MQMAKEIVITLVAPTLGLWRKAMKPGADILPAHRTQAGAIRIQQRGGNAGDAIPRLHHLLKARQVHQVGDSVLHRSIPLTLLGRKRGPRSSGPQVGKTFSGADYTPKSVLANPASFSTTVV